MDILNGLLNFQGVLSMVNKKPYEGWLRKEIGIGKNEEHST